MALDVFAELQRLLANPRANFFPASLRLPPVGAGADDLPLLRLINDNSASTPQLPLTIGAVQNLITSVGKNDLGKLEENLVNAIKAGNAQDALKAIVAIPQELEALAGQAGILLVHQLIIGASLFFDLRGARSAQSAQCDQIRISGPEPILFR